MDRESKVTKMIQTEDRSKWLAYSNHNIKCFTKDEIEKITSNYGAIIGKGGFGEVYRGVLEDGSTVAVKRFMCNVEEYFAKELKVHSEINHKNVVRLIGYCAEENALMIVTEYISKGNLSHVLHHDCIPLPLGTRLQIAVECSEALCYMHSQMYTHVVHGDIKPANILLDDNFNAKVSDFGISRLVNTDTTLFTQRVIGSIGYMDPLFARYGRLTPKSDVYSFGIVLLELITKKKATLIKGETGIVESFIQALAAGNRRVRELFDIEISSQNNMKVLEGVAKLVGECLSMDMNKRPEMIDVAERLRALRKTQVQGKQTPTIFPWGWRNKPEAQNNGQSSGASEVHVPQSSGASEVHVPQSSGASEVHVPQHLPSKVGRHFSLKEMKSATGNFDESHLAGMGKNGELYCGVIDGGATKVAIRRWRVVSNMNNFETEIVTRAKLHHDHLVSLVGHCKENYQMVLVYEYMAGGTLRGRLCRDNNEEPPLTWRQRLEICIGVARALHYLHECSIIHYDLTTSNIFLDDRLVAKVSCPISSAYSYVDPELYPLTKEPTKKSNVYSFGVVLFEVLCARGVWDKTLRMRRVPFVEYALNCKQGNQDLIVDPCLKGKIDPWCFNKFFETAEQCVRFESADRPSMREVLDNLEMCLAERSMGNDMPIFGEFDDDETNRPSNMPIFGVRRQNLEMYLSDQRGRYSSEISRLRIPDGR